MRRTTSRAVNGHEHLITVTATHTGWACAACDFTVVEKRGIQGLQRISAAWNAHVRAGRAS
jgi:hypothetical protein